MTSTIDMHSESPLKWPEDRPRTRFQDRKSQGAWKMTYADTMKGLERELRLAKATAVLVTHHPHNHEDSGVAVWISRKPIDDYGWQDALGFIGRVPTEKEIDHAYMQRVRKHAPDGPTPNITLFHELTTHRDNARRWLRGERKIEHETVMAVDAFKEVRHNLNAIRITLSALRQIERCGSPVMMEQAWRGFRPALAANASSLERKEVRDAAAVTQ